MTVEVEDLIRDVRVSMDLNRRDESLAGEGDPDTLLLDELIESKVCEGIDLVHLEAPVWELEGEELPRPSDGSIALGSRGEGGIELPEDFLRLVSFQLRGWQKAVHEVYYPGDLRFEMQQSRWAGIYGSPEKPAVTIEPIKGGKILRFYSGTPDSQHSAIQTALYVRKAEITEEREVDVSRECYRAVVARIVDLVKSSLGM